MLEQLKEEVCRANLQLPESGLVIFSWGNVSGIDRRQKMVAIKPSGISYDALSPDQIVLVDLQGQVVEGDLKPSSDTPTHLELYRQFPALGGVCHTHSTQATAWAQAGLPIPCYGTTHADHFYGEIPVTKVMTEQQVNQDYEKNTGTMIVQAMANLDPRQMPAILVVNHGPFTWGDTPDQAVENAVILEQVARMARDMQTLKQETPPIKQWLLDRHYLRKHGKNAYYGQNSQQ